MFLLGRPIRPRREEPGAMSLPALRRSLRMRRREPRQRIDTGAQFVRQRLPVADRGKLGEGDWRSDRDRQAGPDSRLDLMEDEREPERRAHVARDLEQAPVLAAEPDR